MSVKTGQVVKFCDDANKKRPAVVLSVRRERFAVIIEGTGQGSWKGNGEPVLYEVGHPGRLATRMGLDRRTYFYGDRRRLHLLPIGELYVSSRVYTCPDDAVRRLQAWAFAIVGDEAGDLLPEVGSAVGEQLIQADVTSE
jgi:hypothetical protein